jgi:molybdopterin converting factor small subunit
MKVEVRFFGQLVDKLGLASYVLEVSALEYEAVRDDLEQAFPGLKLMSYQLAQNNAIIEGENALDQSAVDVFPPFSGG